MIAGKGDFSVARESERSDEASTVVPLSYASGITERGRNQVVVKPLWKPVESTSW